MPASETHLTKIARWAATVTPADVPSRVIKLARLQILSVLGAVWAGGS